MLGWGWLLLTALLLHLMVTSQAMDIPSFLRNRKQLALAPDPDPSLVPALAGLWQILTDQKWSSLGPFVGVVTSMLVAVRGVLAVFFAEDDIGVLQLRLSEPNQAVLRLTAVEEPIVFRKDLHQSFHKIVDQLKQSVLIWGEHKAGKSTFIQEAIKAETRRGRPVLHVHAKERDTFEQLLARLFRWSKTAHFARRWLRIPTRSSEMPEIDPIKLTGLDNRHGLPLLVIDNINKLSTRAICLLLDVAKEFVDMRIGVFVFVLSSGAKGKEFISQSAMSRVKTMYVGDVAEHETLSYLKEVGRTEEDARQILYLVGGRWEYLMEARASDFDFNAFRTDRFGEIERKVLEVSAIGWDEKDTLQFLFLFLEGSGQVKSDVFVKRSDGIAEAVERMLKAILIQYRLDNGKYELHSTLVQSYLVEKRKEGSA